MQQYKMNRLLYILLLSVLFCMNASAQSARDLIRLGNVAYKAKQYVAAETMYIKSIEKSPSFEAYYNLGNALVMQQKDSTAFVCYQKADSIGTNDPLRRARLFHNVGNIFYAQGLMALKQNGPAAQSFQAAVNNFASSLRCNPNDDETRYNLAMALYMLKKNKDKTGDGGGGNDDKNKDKDQDKKDQQQQQQNQDQEKQDQQKQQPQQQKDDMSDQAAEQLLNSAQQDEKSVQRKVNQNQNGKRRNLEKDW